MPEATSRSAGATARISAVPVAASHMHESRHIWMHRVTYGCVMSIIHTSCVAKYIYAIYIHAIYIYIYIYTHTYLSSARGEVKICKDFSSACFRVTYAWVMFPRHICMSHVAYENIVSRMNASCQISARHVSPYIYMLYIYIYIYIHTHICPLPEAKRMANINESCVTKYTFTI